MRAVSVGGGEAVVVTSLLWQTTCTAIRAGDEAMVIDSPYFPDELELLPTVLAQSGFEPVALLATHCDFDHLLGPIAYPGMSLGVAESTALRLQAEPGAVQRELRDTDAEYYVSRTRPLSLGGAQSLPVPGRVDLGDQELELHPTEGHTPDGMAVFAPWLGLLCCGDYLSDVEIPLIQRAGSLSDYRATLQRLAPVVERAETVVPGHGSPHTRDRALKLLEEDLLYLDVVERGEEKARLPRGRDSTRQRQIHRDNVTKHGPG